MTFKTIDECQVILVAHTVDTFAAPRTNMDGFPAQAARVSFANDMKDTTDEQDAKLIHYLADHKHLTPFEYQHATLMIECPLFVRSQIHRHRLASYNEISRRYTSDELNFWIPSELHQQSTKNKQGSTAEVIQHNAAGIDIMKRATIKAEQEYRELLNLGVAREQARAVLPQNLLTRFYMGTNLRGWAHFFELRLDSHAQYETRAIAQKCYDAVQALWPTSLAALMDNVVNDAEYAKFLKIRSKMTAEMAEAAASALTELGKDVKGLSWFSSSAGQGLTSDHDTVK